MEQELTQTLQSIFTLNGLFYLIVLFTLLFYMQAADEGDLKIFGPRRS